MVSVITLTETWFTNEKSDKDSLLQIPNFLPVYRKRANNLKGGVIGAIIRDKVNFKIIKIQVTRKMTLKMYQLKS